MPWGVIKRTYTIPEKKFHDVDIQQLVDSSGNSFLLNGLLLGTSAETRVGQKTIIKSWEIRLTANGPQGAGTPTITSSFLRCMVIWDVQPNGVLAGASDVLQSPAENVRSPIFMGNSHRFKILYDEVMPMGVQLSVGQVLPPNFLQWIKKYMKCNLETRYSDTNNGDISDIVTGSLVLLLISNAPTNADRPAAEVYTRIRFFDN